MVSTLREFGKLPVHPPKIDVHNDKFQIDAMRWNFFTMLPNMRINIKNYHESIKIFSNLNQKKLEDLQKNNSPAHKNPLDTFEFSRQSLIPYYNLLPKWAHENPAVQNIIRSLEFNHNQFSFQQKLIAINIALPLLLPIDDKLAAVAKEINDIKPEEITMDNIEELLLHNEDETRKHMILPEDDFTDDKEEFYTFYTAADIRAIEKEEEEERKLKKREEGRAKRAAEEAKAAGESGKKKEEKKDPKDEKKAAATPEETQEAEPEKEEDQEEEEDIGTGKTGDNLFDLDDEGEVDEESAFKTKKPKSEKKKIKKEENKYITERKEALQLIDIKKDQDRLFSQFLKKYSSIKLNEDYINISRDMIDVKTGKIDLSKYNMQEIPLSLIMVNKFVNEYDLTKNQIKEFLDIIKKNPNIDLRVSMSKNEKEEYVIIENDPKDKKKQNEVKEENVFEDEDAGDLDELYRSSLKETEMKIESEEDMTLKDVYYKPAIDMDYYEKSYHLPLDYYDNNDGFYDEWLKNEKEKIDISQYNLKPFISKRKRIKHISEIEI